MEVQIFVSLALVLGALFVALLTDFLKGNNEALRERNIELVVRQEERERHASGATVHREQEVAAPRAMFDRAVETELPPVDVATPAKTGVETATAGSGLADVEPPAASWATDGELAAVNAIAARIRESISTQAAHAKSKRESARVEEDDEIPFYSPAVAGKAQFEPEGELAVESGEPASSVAEAAAAPAAEEVAMPEEEIVADAGEALAPEIPKEEQAATQEETPEPAVGDSGDESVADDAGAAEEETRRVSGLPRFTIHTKVTPIDVMAAERAAASEAIRLARELEQLAEITAQPRVGPSDVEESAYQSAAEELEPEAATPVEEVEAAKTAESEDFALSGSVLDAVDETEVEPSADQEDDEPEAAETAAEEEDAGDEVVASEHRTVLMPERTASEDEVPPLVKIPSGFQEYSLLAEALESDGLFRGTIVAIAVSGAGRSPGEETLDSVGEFVESLLTPADFACSYGQDEFLVILPEELGSQAQRRLQHISQRLWDYQIRSVSHQPAMFSWGAAEITGEPLRDAVEAARDRMLQTKRTRERATAEIHNYRKRAAND